MYVYILFRIIYMTVTVDVIYFLKKILFIRPESNHLNKIKKQINHQLIDTEKVVLQSNTGGAKIRVRINKTYRIYISLSVAMFMIAG